MGKVNSAHLWNFIQRDREKKEKKMQLIFAQIVVLYLILHRIKSGNSFENIDSGKQSTK